MFLNCCATYLCCARYGRALDLKPQISVGTICFLPTVEDILSQQASVTSSNWHGFPIWSPKPVLEFKEAAEL